MSGAQTGFACLTFPDRIKPDDASITTFLDDLLHRKYQIPTFQREVVWDGDQVKRLWDSIFRFYPIGSILIWKTDVKLHNHRMVGGFRIEAEEHEKDFQYLLDGQQRTTALLTGLYGGKIDRKDDFDPALYIDLSIPFADDESEDSYRSRFLFWTEIDDKSGTLIANKGRTERFKKGQIVQLKDVRSRYAELERRLNDQGYSEFDHPFRELLRRIKSVLDNYRVPFIILRGIKIAEVCEIFERVNREGTPLSVFDIVVAKTFRSENRDQSIQEFYLRQKFEDLRTELPAGSSYANVDDGTILQMLACIIGKFIPDSNVLNITDRYLLSLKTEWIEKVWIEAKIAIKRTYDFFDNILSLKGPQLIPFRYFYMAFAVYFWKRKEPDYESLIKYFWYVSFHTDDLLSNTTQLRSHLDVLSKTNTNLASLLADFRIDKHALRSASYSTRGRFSRAILAFLSYRCPQDWASPFRDVHTSVYYVLVDRPNLHHIFPLNFIAEHPGKNEVDVNSLMNIAYLTQLTNLRISDENPLIYISDLDVPGFDAALKSHLVPQQIRTWASQARMPEDALDQFVEARSEIFIDQLKESLSGIPFAAFDSRKGNSIADLA